MHGINLSDNYRIIISKISCESAVPLTHIESGMLISSGGFQHINRKLDYYVLLLGREGTLYLTSENIQYEIKPHTYLLFAAWAGTLWISGFSRASVLLLDSFQHQPQPGKDNK